VKNLWVY